MKNLILIVVLFHSLYAGELDNQSILVAWGKVSCYDLGYKYGSCVMRSYKGLTCISGTDIVIPLRCRNKEETKDGIQAGIRSEK